MDDVNEKVRSAAARAMRWIGGPDSTQSLIQALSDPAERVAVSAAGSLGVLAITEAADSLVVALLSGRDNLASAAADALGKIGDSHAVTPLIDILKSTGNRYVRSSAVKALINLAPDAAVEQLITMLHSSDSLRRDLAVEALGMLKNSRAANSIAELLSDDNPGVARSAAFALASIGDQRAVDPLLALLQTEPRMEPVRIGVNPDVYRDEDMNRYVRDAAAKALGKLGDARAVEALATSLKDPSVEQAAALSLAQFGDERGVQHLLTMLKSAKKQHVCNIVQALGESGNPRAVRPLVELLDSKTRISSMQPYILSALARIGTRDAVDAIESVMTAGGESAIDAAAELAKLGHEDGYEYLRSELQGGDEKQRSRVVMKLYFISDPQAVDLLISVLQDRSEDVRLWAIRALGKIDNKSALNALDSIMNDPNRRMRIAASTAARKIKVRLRTVLLER